jgi:DNA-binding CsgD family transcriptional regulator
MAYAERVERFNDRHYMAAHLAHVRWATGDWDGALTQAQLALADGRGGITTRITALHVLGFVHLGRGSFADAVAALSEAASLGEGMSELQRTSPAWWGLAEAALRQDDPAAATAWCERGYAASARVGDAAYLFPYVVTGVRALLAVHDPTGAHGWLDRTSVLLRERGIPGTLAAIDHGRGLIYLHEGLTGKARAALDRAAGAWAARQRFWEGTDILLDQARCAVRSRRPADAAAFRAAAESRLASVGVLSVPPASSSLLSGGSSSLLSGGSSSAGSLSGGSAPARLLSSREVEVAQLVATGATNREIAAMLSIAPKTVAAHVEHILAKLGVSRRAQIATWAATQQ